MKFDPNRTVPEEISRKAVDLGCWMEMNDATSVYGIGPVFPMQRQIDALTKERDRALAAGESLMASAEGLQRQNYVLSEEVKSLRASGTDLMAHRDERMSTLRRQLAQAWQQRDTALAALGQVQAGAAELMAAADALLRERDNYRAACAAAAALSDKGRGRDES